MKIRLLSKQLPGFISSIYLLSLASFKRKGLLTLLTPLFFLLFFLNSFSAFAQFPYEQDFKGNSAPGVIFGGTPTAFLTGGAGPITNGVNDAVGNGYLRLTDNSPNQTGFVYSNRVFSGTYGLNIEFEYFTYGGSGADGICFFLFDAAVPDANFVIGGFGGSLGYSQSGAAPGVSKGYLGIGLDEYGNFSNQTESRQGGDGFFPDAIVLRNAGNSNQRASHMDGQNIVYDDNGDNYKFLIKNQVFNPANNTGFRIAGGSRTAQPGNAGYRKLFVNLAPRTGGGLVINVSIQHGAVIDNVITNYQYTTPVPAAGLKYGISSSTGGTNNFHEIRGLTLKVDPKFLQTPEAANFTKNICQGQPVIIDVLAGATTPNAGGAPNPASVNLDLVNHTNTDPLQTVVQPGIGTFVYDPNTTKLTFTPLLSFFGTTTLDYNFMDIYGAVSKKGTVTINVELPVITAQPASNTVCEGSSFTTSATVNAGVTGAQIAYQWQYFNTINNDWEPVNEPNASGQGTQSLTITNVPFIDNGRQYKVVMTTTGGCVVESLPATLTVNPTARVIKPADQTLCNQSSTGAINFTGNITGNTYNWVNDAPSIGLVASGTGNIASFTAINNSDLAVVAHITVTPASPNGCNVEPQTFTITVNPTAKVDKPVDQELCTDANTAAVNFTGNITGNAYRWTNDTPTIGLVASGNGNIGSFKAINASNLPVTAKITVIPTSPSGCEGTPQTFNIKINPTAKADKPVDQELCDNSNTNVISFTGNITGNTYKWTNDTPTIGLAASGNGDIASFTAANPSDLPVTAHITVIPTSPSGCEGVPQIFNIKVNPSAKADKPVNQELCNTINTAPVSFTGNITGNTYRWTNDTPAIGLVASGNGDIASFKAVNEGDLPVTAHLTVTPTSPAGCQGTPQAFTITVDPTAKVNKPANQKLCNSGTTNGINFTGNITGNTYRWTNDTPAIGLAASGNGDIASFTVTNPGDVAVVAHITVIPTSPSGCEGAPQIFTITVDPTAKADKPADQELCNFANTNAINFTGNITGNTYRWTNDTPTIGLVGSGNGNIASFPAVNFSDLPVVAHITVIPTSPSGCEGQPQVFTITVNPTAKADKPADQELCNNANTIAVSFTGNINTNTYKWTNDAVSIGLAASGNGDIASFTATNPGDVPVVAHITVIPTSPSGCVGTPQVFTITVNPTAKADKPTDQELCNNNNTTTVTFTGNINNNTYRWLNDEPSIGLNATGAGNITSFKATNTTDAPVVAHITVIPTSPFGCEGLPQVFTITVNPTAKADKPSDQELCNNANTIAVNFTGNITGNTYRWTNDTPLIGLAASGNGNIGSFPAINTGDVPVVAHITVIPTSPSGCEGEPQIFTITVNPTAKADKPADQELCNNSNTTAITFTGNISGNTYKWTNDDASIGLAVSGNGNIAGFTATNPGDVPVVAHITVIPTSPFGCEGLPQVFTITVNPTAKADKPANQELCNNANTVTVNFTGNITGNTYRWTNDTPTIGLVALGNGNIASFTAINQGDVPVVAHITVIPTSPFGCEGQPQVFTITVNPTAKADKPADQELCNNANTLPVTFTGNISNNTYRWTNDAISIGLAALGNGDIASFTATNPGDVPVVAHITVIPTSPFGCEGQPQIFTITVNPTAKADKPADQELCNNNNTTTVTFTGNINNNTYRWLNDEPSIGLNATGAGNITSFKATNTTDAPVVAHITVIPTSPFGCEGLPQVFTITVNPTAKADKPSDQELCNNANTIAVNFTGNITGNTYRWTNDTPLIGLAASGNGNIGSFPAINTGDVPVVAHITVIPTSPSGCEGEPQIFTITVNPTAKADKPADQELCNNSNTTAITFTGNISGNTYKWTNDDTSIGLAVSGNGNIAGFTASNPGDVPVVAHITVIPTSPSGCEGQPQIFTITVNPTAKANKPADQELCNQANTVAINFTGNITGNTYRWINDTPVIGLVTSGNGNIASFQAINLGDIPVVAHITVIPTSPSGCEGQPQIFTITVDPTAKVNKPADQELCNNSNTVPVAFTGNIISNTYRWSNDNISIGLRSGGIGNIPAFTATNPGDVPVVAHITVIPTSPFGCEGLPQVFTITVNPTAKADKPADQELCNQANTIAVNFTGNITGNTYKWTNDNPAIGLVALGNGNIASFKGINTSDVPVIAHITVTPTSPFGCEGLPKIFTITVNPTAKADKPADQELCNNANTTAINFTGNILANTYRWINDTPLIGLAASGNGNIASFIAVNPGDVPVVAHITVIPTSPSGCEGEAQIFTITVNPTAKADKPADQELCNNANTTAVTFTGNITGNTYKWTNDKTSIGLAASGNGNIASFQTVNTGDVPVVAHITVIPTSPFGCDGQPQIFTITVNPTAKADKPADQELCNNTNTIAVNFTGNIAANTYRWINDTPVIGLVGSGSGNIASFQAVNLGDVPVVAHITVIPTSPFGCEGQPKVFTITVNPTAKADKPADQELCNNANTIAVNFTGSITGNTYRWTNDAISIGLAASGNGSIASFTASNPGDVPVVAHITVIPTSPFGCEGLPETFTITINPTAKADKPADQELCNQANTIAVNFTGNITGNTYKWINDTPTIGLVALGNGNIASFKAINASDVPVVAHITVIPTSPSGCEGQPQIFTITVNPTAKADKPADQELCNNANTIAVNFTGNITANTYRWLNDTPAIGLAASGNGNITSFQAINPGDAPVVARITVIPTSPSGCEGQAQIFTITVNPTAKADKPADQELCNNANTTAVTFTGNITGNTYKWTNDKTSIGLAASGNGNIASFQAVNTGDVPVVAHITVIPTSPFGCEGQLQIFTITVNPTAKADKPADQELCNQANTAAIAFTGNIGGNTYRWTNDQISIGLAASGNGNIASFTAVNPGDVPVVAHITVIPTSPSGCEGQSQVFTITVNPTAKADKPADQELCNNTSTIAINFTGNIAANTYRWTNDVTSIGLTSFGNGNIASFTAINQGNQPVVAHITVIPTSPFGCEGQPQVFTITVNPTAKADKPADQDLCNNTNTAPINLTGNVNGNTYRWTNDESSIGLAASGTGNIASFQAVNTGDVPVVAHITVIPTSPSGCEGAPQIFKITVYPTARADRPADQEVCNNSNTIPVTFTGNITNNTYRWSNDMISIGLRSGGAGNIPAFTAINPGNVPVVAHITVIPTSPFGCEGQPQVFTITVNPTAKADKPADQELCNNANTIAVNFTGNINGNTYRWINDVTSIGLAASGNGDIASFRATNSGDVPVVAHITVIPTSPSGCEGQPQVFTITVNPTAKADKPADQELCNNANTIAVNFTGNINGNTYRWINDVTSIGLAASGNGDIASFRATNSGDVPIVAHITVIPTSPSGCEGQPKVFTITVNPTAKADRPADQELCNNANSNAINFTGNISGNSYRWTNDLPQIGLAASGSGNIASFPAINQGNVPVVAHITVTPTSPSGCEGVPQVFTITVNPTPTVVPVSVAALCNGANQAGIVFSSPVAGTTYHWTKDGINIGLSVSSGDGNLPAFIAVNTTDAPLTSTFTVTPKANGCEGIPMQFTITVNPDAAIHLTSAAATANQADCINNNITVITYKITNATRVEATGLPADVTGTFANGVFTISGAPSALGTFHYTVTATGICRMAQLSGTITVNPRPAGYNDIISNLSCGNTAISYNLQDNINNTARGGNAVPSTFTWTAVPNGNVTGVTNGSGNAISTTLYNLSQSVQQVVYTVTPTSTLGGCPGQTFTVTVNVPVCSGITITKTADVNVVSQAGDLIRYTITVKNIATANHTGVKVTDPFLGGILTGPASGDNGNEILEANESWVYTGTYRVTQADVDNNGKPNAGTGKIINTATVNTIEHPELLSASSSVDIVTTGDITLVKEGILSRDFSTITYTFTVTNTGKVRLHNLNLMDPKMGGRINLNPDVLEAGASVSATVIYTVTDAEKRDGQVINTATVTGATPAGDAVTDISGTQANNNTPTVNIIDDAPQAINDNASTPINQPVTFSLTDNDLPSFNGLDRGSIIITKFPANGIVQVNPDGTVTYTPNRTYSGPDSFMYTITDLKGKVSNKALVSITVIPIDLFIPNTFTPNGDGKNDTFRIIGRESFDSLDLLIFNRWGNEVFRRNNYLDDWDGSGLNEGTYYYLITLKKGGNEIVKKGWILLKR